MRFILHWLIATAALLVAAYILPGVTISGFVAALITALVLGLLNAFLRPLLLFLTLPINLLTLGLFTFVINAGLVMLAGYLVPGFQVANFWWALLFSVVLTLIAIVFEAAFKTATSGTPMAPMA